MRLLRFLAKIAGRLLPEPAFWRLHGLVAAVITPWRFSILSGHLRSSFVKRPVARDGRPIPWMTYPAIEFLENKVYPSKRVLEWGSGNSTLWWAARAEQVVAFESDISWFHRVKRRAPPNVELTLVDDDLLSLPPWPANTLFDVIVIDGLNRLRCAEASISLLKEDGAVVLDDSDQTWLPSNSDHYEIINLFRRHGFKRVDFYGFAPSVIRRHCTSVFFRERCFLLEDTAPPRRYD